ncbi:hypothetical protein ATANTOWER_010527 [Ataeniobius toweri]|uniref:Uncharacterized protein n=1 Tax=Ataeniobius toweri TaxID=208326 RepID=A0ABU7AA18_9TELE|nr:hypothetical protein [Ataeniobius toweri]
MDGWMDGFSSTDQLSALTLVPNVSPPLHRLDEAGERRASRLILDGNGCPPPALSPQPCLQQPPFSTTSSPPLLDPLSLFNRLCSRLQPFNPCLLSVVSVAESEISGVPLRHVRSSARV